MDRLNYQGMVDGTHLAFAQDTKLVVWIIVNVEYWDMAMPMPRSVLPPPMGEMRLPDIPNWSWHEYGMRRGFWRIKSALDRRHIIPTLSINAHVCKAYSKIATVAKEANWEFMGHSYKQMPMHNLNNERETIAKTVDTITNFVGKPPVGWLGPGLTQTAQTLDLLSENGIAYVGDWVVDDLPVSLKTNTHKPMVALPYTVELNDIPVIAIQNHSVEEFKNRCIRQFDRLYEEANKEPRILSIAVHPFLTGVPHRINYFESVLDRLSSQAGVEFWTGEKILEWYLSQDTAKSEYG